MPVESQLPTINLTFSFGCLISSLILVVIKILNKIYSYCSKTQLRSQKPRNHLAIAPRLLISITSSFSKSCQHCLQIISYVQPPYFCHLFQVTVISWTTDCLPNLLIRSPYYSLGDLLKLNYIFKLKTLEGFIRPCVVCPCLYLQP